MKALFFREHGGLDKLQYGELETPSPGEGEVLVQVKACALNHLDLWVLKGWPNIQLPMPHVGGADIAGVIAEVGSGVADWKAGTRVVVNPGVATVEDQWTRRNEDSLSLGFKILSEDCNGGFAEYAVVPARNLLPIPHSFSDVEAAAPLLVGVTCWRMLKHRAQLQSGETVLIVGTGGGLNSLTIQIAKNMGAKVIGLTSSEEKMQRSKELGADIMLNYKSDPEWSREVKKHAPGGVDVVVDNVGAATMMQSLRSLRRGGRVVTVGNTSGQPTTIDSRLLFRQQLSIIGSTMGSAQDFREVMEQVWSGKVKPVVDTTFPLSEGRAAYERMANGEQFGKIVLTP